MHVYTLACEILVNKPIHEVFAFFENPYNLARITPSWLNFQVTSRERVRMQKGAEIHYTIRWLGLPMPWKTIIAEYEPPYVFVDVQEKGPYAFWRHRHTFEETSEGVKVRDHVDYAVPLGALGRLAHAIIVRKQLEAIFRYRQQQLSKVFDKAKEAAAYK